MDSYGERVKRLQSVSQGLKEYLDSLPHEAWSSPSACDQWQIADVVAHLSRVAESYADSVSRGLKGDSSPTRGRPPAGTRIAATSAENIAQSAISTRERLGDQLLATFEETDGQLNRVLAGLKQQEQDIPCYHAGGIVPAGNFVDLRLKELSLHDWDIRSGLEPEAQLSAEGLPSIIELLKRSLASGSLHWAFWPGPKLPSPVRYRFEVTGPIPLNADITVEGDQARLEEPSERTANAAFYCDTETFVLLINGRLPIAEAIEGGRLEATGDSNAVAQFSQWFKGI